MASQWLQNRNRHHICNTLQCLLSQTKTNNPHYAYLPRYAIPAFYIDIERCQQPPSRTRTSNAQNRTPISSSAQLKSSDAPTTSTPSRSFFTTLSLLTWATFTTLIIITIPTIALGWMDSPHKPGKLKDADFWFLIQNCGMTLLSLVTLAVPLWATTSREHSIERPRGRGGQFLMWLFMLMGVVLTIAAPAVYLHLPTEWSSFLNVGAGAIQAFATLQVVGVFVGGNSTGDRAMQKV